MSKKKITMWIVLAVVALFAIGGAALAVRYFSADVRGRVDAQETIKSGDSRIANYNEFFNLCAAVQTHEGTLRASQDQFNLTTDSDERQRILANITGIRSARIRVINTYNANSAKNYTAGQFRDSDLPYQLSTIEGGSTKCADVY